MICGNCKEFKTKKVREALSHFKACVYAEWEEVITARRAGENDKADRLVKKILGITGPPMTEEKKAELRAYREEHKEELAEKARLKRQTESRTKQLIAEA